MSIGIYKITSPNGRIYIGQSINIEKRWSYYKKIKCGQQRKIYNSLKKYGPENHVFEIVEECDIDLLNERELYWGKFFDSLSKNNLNLRLGKAQGKVSDETKSKISQSNLGKVKHTDIFKQKLSQKQLNNTYALGNLFTPESKAKITKAKTGHICYNKERNKKIGNSNKGKVRNEIHKQNYSNAHKGIPRYKPKMEILNNSDILIQKDNMSFSRLSLHYGVSIPVIKRFLKSKN
jgi:group I intron endonuclease